MVDETYQPMAKSSIAEGFQLAIHSASLQS